MSFNFDRAAGFYDATRGFPDGEDVPVARLMVEAGNLNTSSRILEVGIGTGRIAVPLTPYVKAIHGVDISHLMMQKIRDKQTEGQIYPVQADALKLPYADHSFDAVVLVHILHLVPDIDLTIREIGRVLKPDGLVLNCWNTDDRSFQDFRKIWSKFADSHTRDRWRMVTTCFADKGWQIQSEPFTHTYVKQRIPNDFVEAFRNRTWSSTWNLTDTELEDAYQDMQILVKETFDDPAKPIDVSNTFYVTVYAK